MPVLVAQADYNIAYLYYFRGDYSRALESAAGGARRVHHNGDLYHVALCNLDQSEIYLELNLSDEAAEMAHGGAGGIRAAWQRLRGRAVADQPCHRARSARRDLPALELFGQARSRFAARA